MTHPADCLPIGQRRISEADSWDRDHPDLVGLAPFANGADSHGEFAFPTLQAGLKAKPTPSSTAC